MIVPSPPPPPQGATYALHGLVLILVSAPIGSESYSKTRHWWNMLAHINVKVLLWMFIHHVLTQNLKESRSNFNFSRLTESCTMAIGIKNGKIVQKWPQFCINDHSMWLSSSNSMRLVFGKLVSRSFDWYISCLFLQGLNSPMIFEMSPQWRICSNRLYYAEVRSFILAQSGTSIEFRPLSF